jgi:hypothetical protein
MTEHKPIKKKEILVKDLGKETLLYAASGKEIHVLNPTAQMIWELCDGEHTPTDMEKRVRSKFSIPEGRNVLEDVLKTLSSFEEKGLLSNKQQPQALV